MGIALYTIARTILGKCSYLVEEPLIGNILDKKTLPVPQNVLPSES